MSDTTHRRSLATASLLLICLMMLALCVMRPALAMETRAGAPVEMRALNTNSFTRVPPPPMFSEKTRSRSATFSVVYHNFTPEAEAAFQYAVDIWSTLINTPVIIHVDATWTALGPGVLGSAGPKYYRQNFSGAPRANTYYPDALANALHGSDLDTGNPEIVANFSNAFTWYLGTDGNTPAGQYDFVTVVLHELGHGLGFLGTAGYNSSTGQGGWGISGVPAIYDDFVVNSSGVAMMNTSTYPNPSSTLGTFLRSGNVFWDGANAKAANGGARPELYAPGSWQGGSSYCHLDETVYPAGDPNSLMTPAAGAAESIHTPGPITLGLYRDLGWSTAVYNPQPDLWIGNPGTAYIGNGIYNTTASGQTKTQAVYNNATARYYVVLQSDSTSSDAYRVRGTAGDANWSIRYYDGATEITSLITSTKGWTCGSMTPGATKVLTVNVIPGAALAYGTARAVTVTATAEGNLTRQDVVKAITSVLRRQPDLKVKTLLGRLYTGENIYNTDGTGQTVRWDVHRGDTSTFNIAIQNDGTQQESFRLVGWPGAAGYHARYFSGTTEITAQIITGTGWFTPTLLPGAATVITAQMTPDATISEGGQQTLLVTAYSRVDSSKRDAVKVITRVIRDQPDLQLRTASETAYLGNNIYSTTGAGQTKQQMAPGGSVRRFTVMVQNDGTNPDTINVTAWPGAAYWHITYIDVTTGGDITAAITGPNGWTTGTLQPQGYQLISVVSAPENTIGAGASQSLLITGQSTGTATKRDAVIAKFVMPTFQPDGQVAVKGGALVGDNIYNLLPDQTVTRSVATVLAVYQLRLQNDGNDVDSVTVRGTTVPTGLGWTVRYLDALTGGADITADVIAGTYLSKPLAPSGYQDIRVEVKADATVGVGTMLPVTVTLTSKGDTTKTDAVRAETTKGSPVSSVSLTATPPSPSPIMTQVLLTASADSGVPVEYQFLVGTQSGGVYTWNTLQPYGSSPTATWVTEMAGTYYLKVYVREAGSTAAYQAYKVIQYVLKNP